MPKLLNKKKQKAPKLPAGCKVVPAPKSAFTRQLLSEADVTTSGGCHTVHGAGAAKNR